MFNLFRSTKPSRAKKTSITKDSVKITNTRLSAKLTDEQLQLIDRVEHAYNMAELYFKRQFPRPEVGFKLRGKSAGTAHLQENRLRFNPVLLTENIDGFHQEVVPHEVSHLLAYQLYGRVKPHGPEWQGLMAHVFKLNPNTTHSLDVSSVSGKTFSYRCDCGPVSLSIRRHNKVLRGETHYRCRRCDQALIKAD